MPTGVYTLDTCHTAAGTVVVIDVIRAFTTAAYAFAAGAERILMAGEVEQALALRRRFPGAPVMGEVGGLPVAEFDLWNSPEQVSRLDLSGKTIIQRTSSGTQGVLCSTAADLVLASSFVVAEATVCLVNRMGNGRAGFVATGVREGAGGVEDVALAEYLSARLAGEKPAAQPYLERARQIEPGWVSQAPSLRELFEKDLARCLEIDRFSFGLVVRRQADLLIMEAVDASG